MRNDDPTQRVRQLYDRLAPRYDAMLALVERVLLADGREWITGQADGAVLEVAVGTGRNLAHYPADVRLTAVDLSPAMLELARRAGAARDMDVALHVADAQRLPFADDDFDTVVCTLGLCSIPDERAAVREMRRVLRPGGRLLLLEHVRSPVRAVRIAQELIEPLFLRFASDHLLREPRDAVECAGFEVEQLTRAKLGLVERLVARAPSAAS
jgi:ubiquinone/menaquinone biosynthesis C-methylase UbiE